MPMYEYKCPKCGEFEKFLPLAEFNKKVRCKCGKRAKKKISANVHGDETPWLNNVNDVLGEEVPTITSRSQLRRYCKDNGIEQVG